MVLGKSDAVMLEIHACCFGFGVWMSSFVFIFHYYLFMHRGMTFCKFLCICFRFGRWKCTLACIFTVTFEDPVNKFPTGFFQYYGCLSKGDPITLLLCYFLVMKTLTRMIARAASGILIVFQVGKEIEISNFIIHDHRTSSIGDLTELGYLSFLLLCIEIFFEQKMNWQVL